MAIKKRKSLSANTAPMTTSHLSANIGGSEPVATANFGKKTSVVAAKATLKAAKKGVSQAQKETPMAKEPKGKVTDEAGFAQKDGGEWRMKYLERMKKRK